MTEKDVNVLKKMVLTSKQPAKLSKYTTTLLGKNLIGNMRVSKTMYYGRYNNSSGRGRGGPAFWFEKLTAETRKIANKINPLHSFYAE